jgi:xanthine dehydrogenase molybdopterin binding subunit/xanthine dehydrogenase small subunit
MTEAFQIVLNGQAMRVEKASPDTTLLEFLRARGLTGTKEGCAEGDCGACTVAVALRQTDGRPVWRAVNSCILPLGLVAGREIVTVEGVAAEGGLHPVQRALVEHHGSQCGYCTPGFVCSLFEAWHRDDCHAPWQIDDQLCGNLCRCTGYRPIRDAAAMALQVKPSSQGSGPEADTTVIPLPSEDCPEFSNGAAKCFYPRTLDELLRLLRRVPEARLVAGATELGLDITKRFQSFPALVAIEGVAELRAIHEERHAWRIGAAATLTEIERVVAGEYPALQTMLRLFGSRQIRNRATLGGNLATASPIGDCAPVLLAFDAKVGLTGRGPREMPIDHFFTGYRQTALKEREVLTHVLLPRLAPPGKGVRRSTAFYKISKRREMDIATVSACCVMEVAADGTVQHARLAFGGVAPTPARARRTERILTGRKWNPNTRAAALETLAGEFTPISDVRGTAEFRRAVTRGLLEKFFHQVAVERGEVEDEGWAEFDGVVSTPDRPLPFVLPSPRPSPPAGEREQETGAEAIPSDKIPPHESSHLHVTGAARYVDDEAAAAGALEVWPVCAPHARARILRRDATEARAMPGVRAVLLAEDVPGVNDVGPVRHDEPLLAEHEVSFHGQIVALVVGDSQAACRAAAEKVAVDYEPLPPLLALEEAIARQSFHTQPGRLRRGDAARALAESPRRIEGGFAVAGQEHFYLEMQAALALPGEDGVMAVHSSTQHPSEVQSAVAGVLGLRANRVVVRVPRLGGGFGGKETQAAAPAALAALAAAKTGRPVRVRWNRDQDMMLTGKRHPFLARFEAGFAEDGRLRAVKVELFSNGGWSLDLSSAVLDRALFHLDNAYFLPAVEFTGRVCRTNLASNTAFRGFGGPQGMLVIEEILDRVARALGLPPETVRERNLYRGLGESNTTPYGQELGDQRLPLVWEQLRRDSRFDERRHELADWNRRHPRRKRGLAITPVKFGISFTNTPLNHAGALVLLYLDGSAQVNHGGAEMGQGIHTNLLAVAARELGLPPERIRVMPTSTDKVPNTSATAASCGTDLNGAAVKDACDTLRARLAPVAAALLGARAQREVAPEEIVFREGRVFAPGAPGQSLEFAELLRKAHSERVSLAATGHYRTPDIWFDREAGRGRPFHYFACGAAVSEVEVDGFTGMLRVRRVDVLHDAGQPINAGVARGQIEGGFTQGLGWLTCEELQWDDQGRLLTHSPDTYKIPAIGDAPREFHVAFLENAAQPGVIHGSKAVGEPPLMLAISVREAIRDAVAAFGPGGEVRLAAPATCEAIFLAVREQRQRQAASDAAAATEARKVRRRPRQPA